MFELLQMRKLRPQEGKLLAQTQSGELNPSADSQAVTYPLPRSGPRVKPVWPRWCHHPPSATSKPKVPAREAAPVLGHANHGEFQQVGSRACIEGGGVRRGGLEGEERLANLFCAVVMVQVATKQVSG